MLAAQIGIAAGLLGMSGLDPTRQIVLVAALAVLVAFASSTQDITIDAYRIESADTEWQGAMAAAYVFGYRVALLVAGAGAFYIAEAANWSVAYRVMALLMGIGIVATLLLPEPVHDEQSPDTGGGAETTDAGLQAKGIRGFLAGSIMAPFQEFFSREGGRAIAVLSLIALYKLSDITMGVMANPFYLDLGFSKTEIADVTKVFGFFMTIAGAATGGLLVVRYGVARPLVLAATLVALTNLLFVALALASPGIPMLALVVSADNLCGGLASAVFIAYLSGLTNRSYTATQYALFSSLMTLPAKLVGGFSGIVVESFGYPAFFAYAAVLGIPGIVLAMHLVGQPRTTPGGLSR
jgi:PAT family beta-lactamase induction signal transducer AmpG